MAFAANQLPSPHIAVSIPKEPARPTLEASARHTLKPTFNASHVQARPSTFSLQQPQQLTVMPAASWQC